MINKYLLSIISKTMAVLAIYLVFEFNDAAAQGAKDSVITVPLGGNGWVSKNAQAKITDRGLINWVNEQDMVSIYVRLESAGDLNIALKLVVPDGSSKITVSINKTVLTKMVSNHDTAVINFGKVVIKSPGYMQIKLQGLSKSGKAYATVSDLLLTGTALSNGAAYVKNNKGQYYYWGHRGPSVHLNYKLPDEVKTTAEWFYNEVTVPVGQDVMGSYFMADGFTGGYFGMQVNSPTERHVLFSIWSPFTTNDPKSIPDSLKIQLLKKGSGVHGGEFGGEGSGGQSYLNYPWVAGKTYAFLIHAQADPAKGTTAFTAYFKETSKAEWQLIASFKRPKSGFYLKGLYSFLENFDPGMGDVTRKVFFGNQWVRDTSGKWLPVNDVLFTADATANINYRKDYSGGVEGNRFYLRNCGFFNDFTMLKTNLTKQQSINQPPVINFNKLP
jgi:hypothetical protein